VSEGRQYKGVDRESLSVDGSTAPRVGQNGTKICWRPSWRNCKQEASVGSQLRALCFIGSSPRRAKDGTNTSARAHRTVCGRVLDVVNCILASAPVPAGPPKLNRWRHPESVPVRRQYPSSGHPNPAATHPVPIAVYPNVARPWRDTNGTGHHCCWRRWRRRADNDAQIYVRSRG
jgi:hypothetical protein